MRKLILTTAIATIWLMLTAQSIKTCTYPIGLNIIKKNEIIATRFDFGNIIFNTKLDSAQHTLFCELRKISKDSTFYKNDGKLIAFDLNSKETKWSHLINYATTEVEFHDQSIFINSSAGITTCLNIKNGEECWTSDHPFFITFPKLNTALGYQNKGLSQSLSDILECVNLTTGAILWKRTVNKDFGWNGIYLKNDSTFIILSSGLQEINIKTGKGWNYITETGIKNYSHTLERNISSMGMGIITGVFDFARGNNVLSQINSNLLVDSNYFYFASKNQIAKITGSGTIVWKSKLSKETSLSEISKDKEWIYLINEGRAEYDGKEMYYGKPYVAAYDLKTGKQKYQTELNTKGYSLIDKKNMYNSMELVFKDRIIHFSTETGKILSTTKFDPTHIGYLIYPINKLKTFIERDSILHNLNSYKTNNKYYLNSKKQIIVLDNDLKVIETIQMNNVYQLYGKTKNNIFSLNNHRIVISNPDGKIVGKMNIGENTFLFDNKLWEIGTTAIIEVDTEQFN